ncbi:MAG: class I SAM-dependent methyltransferase [Methanosarcinaceae archaeon]|nr:class I SAM-dependent methyltransferase [Methanosarcinaceae archaeon]
MPQIFRKLLFRDQQVCPSYISFLLDNRVRRYLQNPEELLDRYIHEGQTVIDIGCGLGFFTLPMSRLVGENGRVIAVDIQKGMLNKLNHNAKKAGLQSRIQLHQSQEDQLGITEKVDFALAFWMVHEVLDTRKFLMQIRDILKPDASFLLVEPKMHVSRSRYEDIIRKANEAGLKSDSEPKVWISRAMLFKNSLSV